MGIPGLYGYSQAEISDFLKRSTVGDVDRTRADNIRRNDAGTQVYIETGASIVFVSRTTVSSKKHLHARWYVDENSQSVGHFLCVGGRVMVNNTPTLPCSAYSSFGADAGGRFLYMLTDDYRSALYFLDDTKTVAATIPFGVDRLYVHGEHLFVFGFDIGEYKRRNETKEIIGTVLRIVDKSLLVESVIHIPRAVAGASPFFVEDFEASSGRALCRDRRDPPDFDRWDLYDMGTGKTERIGRASDYGLFLKSDLLRSGTKK
jgi:hypothetical protein